MVNSNDTNGNRTRDPTRAPKKAGLCSVNNYNDPPCYSILKMNHRVFQHASNTGANMTPDTSSTYWGKNDCWLCPINRYKQQDTLW